MSTPEAFTNPTGQIPEEQAYTATVPIISDRLRQQLSEVALIPINDEYGGTVFTHNAFRSPAHYDARVRQLMTQVGAVFVEDETGGIDEYVPDPARARAACRANNIPVTFITDETDEHRMPAAPYNATQKRNRQPIGTADIEFYAHDMGSDHLLPIIIAGAAPIDVFNKFEQMHRDKDPLQRAVRYDEFMGSVSGAIWTNLPGIKSKDSLGFRDFGSRLRLAFPLGIVWGIGDRQVDHLIEELQTAIFTGLVNYGISIPEDMMKYVKQGSETKQPRVLTSVPVGIWTQQKHDELTAFRHNRRPY